MDRRPAYFGSHRMPQVWFSSGMYSGAMSVRKVTEVRPHQPVTMRRLSSTNVSGTSFSTSMTSSQCARRLVSMGLRKPSSFHFLIL